MSDIIPSSNNETGQLSSDLSATMFLNQLVARMPPSQYSNMVAIPLPNLVIDSESGPVFQEIKDIIQSATGQKAIITSGLTKGGTIHIPREALNQLTETNAQKIIDVLTPAVKTAMDGNTYKKLLQEIVGNPGGVGVSRTLIENGHHSLHGTPTYEIAFWKEGKLGLTDPLRNLAGALNNAAGENIFKPVISESGTLHLFIKEADMQKALSSPQVVEMLAKPRAGATAHLESSMLGRMKLALNQKLGGVQTDDAGKKLEGPDNKIPSKSASLDHKDPLSKKGPTNDRPDRDSREHANSDSPAPHAQETALSKPKNKLTTPSLPQTASTALNGMNKGFAVQSMVQGIEKLATAQTPGQAAEAFAQTSLGVAGLSPAPIKGVGPLNIAMTAVDGIREVGAAETTEEKQKMIGKTATRAVIIGSTLGLSGRASDVVIDAVIERSTSPEVRKNELEFVGALLKGNVGKATSVYHENNIKPALAMGKEALFQSTLAQLPELPGKIISSIKKGTASAIDSAKTLDEASAISTAQIDRFKPDMHHYQTLKSMQYQLGGELAKRGVLNENGALNWEHPGHREVMRQVLEEKMGKTYLKSFIPFSDNGYKHYENALKELNHMEESGKASATQKQHVERKMADLGHNERNHVQQQVASAPPIEHIGKAQEATIAQPATMLPPLARQQHQH